MATLIRHPNVAALYDFSRMPDGSYYMVWEFIDGITLEAWLRRYGPLPAPRALEVSHQVLAGLEEIHAQGIVHRDLSPDNIMIRETKDGRLSAKIIDLGIAKRVASEALSMTGTGMFVGQAEVLLPRTGGGFGGRRDHGRAQRPLLLRSRALRDADGKGALRVPDAAGISRQASPRGASPARHGAHSRSDGAGARVHRDEGSREAARPPIRGRPRVLDCVGEAQTGPDNSTDSIPTSLLPESGGRGGWGWLVGGVIALSAAVAALAFVLHRPAGPVHTPRRWRPLPPLP